MFFQFTVSKQSDNQRLDRLVSQQLPNCSRSRAVDLISKGDIRVSDRRKRPGYRVKPGDVVSGTIPDQDPNPVPQPESIPLDILHEDDHVILVNKQAGLVVHPAAGNPSGTLVNGLLYHAPQINTAGYDPQRPGIVHRLDKETSGLILVAKTQKSLEFLQTEFQQHRVKKQYLALVSGNDIPESGEMDRPIGRHPVKRKLMAINYETGKPARTAWQVKQRYETACLLAVRLYTGRTHQIRVHMKTLGYPLLGDSVYQTRQYRRRNKTVNRQMLHAWWLSFRHPFSGRKMAFKADLPEDFQTVLSNQTPL